LLKPSRVRVPVFNLENAKILSLKKVEKRSEIFA